MGSEENTREEVGCGGNEDVKMDEWSRQAGQNERIRGTTKVGEIAKKVQESRLKWYGHVLREEEYVGKMVMPGKRRRGRPRRRWLDNLRNDLSEKELSGEEAQEISTPHKSRKGCRRRSRYVNIILLYRYVLIDAQLPKNIGTSICFKCHVGIILCADFLEKMEAFEYTNFDAFALVVVSCVSNSLVTRETEQR